ncbi:MAG: hypothetical protein QG635_2370, partial [Bacteroidota bacterium]|nr:hypothetical protein [Bacteroidota bacterium]
MKIKLLSITIILLIINVVTLFAVASQYTIDLARNASREIFGTNGVNFLKPMVIALNSTSNSGFYNTAFVPKNDFYVKFGIHGMFGIVRDEDKNFTPSLPTEQFNALKLLGIAMQPQLDTAGLILYIFKTIVYDGIQQKRITVPERASTVLGGYETLFEFPPAQLDTLATQRLNSIKSIPGITEAQKLWLDSLYNNVIRPVIGEFPSPITLPKGGDLSYLAAFVPQLDIGSFYGTELLLRGIPPIDLGEYVGKFAFWGVGLKHCISQWFPRRYFDMAIQAVYQGTQLTNTVGPTKAELEANATIWNYNIHISKRFENIFKFKGDGPLDIYTGVSYDQISISAKYKYYLPVEVQYKLGLLEYGHTEPTPGFPGDT